MEEFYKAEKPNFCRANSPYIYLVLFDFSEKVNKMNFLVNVHVIFLNIKYLISKYYLLNNATRFLLI